MRQLLELWPIITGILAGGAAIWIWVLKLVWTSARMLARMDEKLTNLQNTVDSGLENHDDRLRAVEAAWVRHSAQYPATQYRTKQ